MSDENFLGTFKLTHLNKNKDFLCIIPDYFNVKFKNGKRKYKFYNDKDEILSKGYLNFNNTENSVALFCNPEKSKSNGPVIINKNNFFTFRNGYGSKFGRDPEDYKSTHQYIIIKDTNKIIYTGNYYFSNGDIICLIYERV